MTSNIVTNPLERKALGVAINEFALKRRWSLLYAVHDITEFVEGWLGHCNHASLGDASDARNSFSGETTTEPFIEGHAARARWIAEGHQTHIEEYLIDAIRRACEGVPVGYVSVVVRDVMTTLGLKTTKFMVFAALRALHERGEIELRSAGPEDVFSEELQFCPTALVKDKRWVFVRIQEAV